MAFLHQLMHNDMGVNTGPVHGLRLNEALKGLYEESVIAPVIQLTDWLSNILIKEKSNGKLMFIDPSRTFTKAKVFTIVGVLDHSFLLTTFQGPNGRYRYLRINS